VAQQNQGLAAMNSTDKVFGFIELVPPQIGGAGTLRLLEISFKRCTNARNNGISEGQAVDRLWFCSGAASAEQCSEWRSAAGNDGSQ
jgi:hypothetical protein